MEGEERTAARETKPRAADASRRAKDWVARSCVERGKVNRARDRSSAGLPGGCGSSWCAREWWAAM